MSKSIAALIVVAAVLSPMSAMACDCMYAPLHERYDGADQVFMGEVLEAGDWNAPSATFRVEAQWKGVSSNEVMVRSDSSTCGAYFERGERYLVFAKEGSTSICHRTTPSDLAEAELDLLGPAFKAAGCFELGWGLFTAAACLVFLGVSLLVCRPRRLNLALPILALAVGSAAMGVSQLGQQQRREEEESARLRELDEKCEKLSRAPPAQDCSDLPLILPATASSGPSWTLSGGPSLATQGTRVCVLDTSDWTYRCPLGAKRASRIALAPDGLTVAAADQGVVRLWKLENDEFVLRAQMPVEREPSSVDSFEYSWAQALAFDRSGTVLTVIWRLESSGKDVWQVERWDVSSARLLSQWAQDGSIDWMAMSPEGKSIAIVRHREARPVLQVWDVQMGTLRAEHTQDVAMFDPSVAFSGERALAVKTRNRQIEFFELSGSELKRRWTRQTQCGIWEIAGSEEGLLLSADGAQILNPATGEVGQELGGGTALGKVGHSRYLVILDGGEPRIRQCLRR